MVFENCLLTMYFTFFFLISLSFYFVFLMCHPNSIQNVQDPFLVMHDQWGQVRELKDIGLHQILGII